MRCLFCGKRLPLLRKLTDTEFCSATHRRLFQQEQEKIALARLMDAQKRFEQFTGGGAAGKDGSGERTPDWEKAEQRGFLPHHPAARTLWNMKHLSAEPSEQPYETCLPDFRYAWPEAGSTSAAGKLDIFPEPRRSAPENVTAEEIPLPVEAQATRPQLALPAPSPLRPAEAAPWPWKVCEAKATPRRLEPKETLAAAAAIRPLSPDAAWRRPQWGTAWNGDLAALRPVAETGAAAPAWPAPRAFPSVDFPEERPSRRVSYAFEPVSYSAPVLQDAAPADPGDPAAAARQVREDSPARIAGQLFPLAAPVFVDCGLPVRRGRMRHIYFPLPRLGDLPALVTEVAHRDGAFLRLPKAQCGAWRPGRVPVRFSISLKGRKRRPAVAIACLEFQFSGTTTLPRFEGGVQTMELASLHDRLPVALPFAALPAGRPQTGANDLIPAAGEAAAPLRPRHGLRAVVAGALLPPSSLLALPAATQPGESAARQPAVEPLVSAATGHIQLPMHVSSSGPILRTPPESERMAPVVPGVSNRALLSRAPAVAAPLPVATTATAVVPSQGIPFCGPAVRANILPLSLGDAVSAPYTVVTRQDLTNLTPDPLRCLPRLRASILEDSEMREAVRAMAALVRHSTSWRAKVQSRLPSLHVPHPDLKWFTMSIPVLLLLSVYFAVNRDKPAPGVGRNPAEVAEAQPPAQPSQEPGFLKTHLGGLQESIMRRAAISLSDDFRSGLGDWEGKGDWSRRWSYDKAGFLKTGPLALYTPSLTLTDYHMEFLGQIDKKSIGWVYRAVNTENYYAGKITLVRGGPLPSAVIERYAVIDGKTSSYESRPLPLQIRTDTLYRVRMDVEGSDFTLSVQGQVVDYWSDNRLKSGGIGFFSNRGEEARLRWVEVTHQYDFLGRLCAFLAPYNLPAKDGSLRQ